jgi:hypothetical protein
MTKTKFPTAFSLLFGLFILTACGEKSIEKSEEKVSEPLDSSKASIVNVSGELFSIPSPIQTAVLIRNSNAEYRADALSSVDHYKEYASNAKKALNLGVFGADLAYSSIYEDGTNSLTYFKALDHLATDLNVSGSISPELVERLGANADNPDSLLALTGKFYAEGDAYLKENKRYEIATLVLLGGWIESSYLTSLSALEGNEDARQRLAEQKMGSSTLQEIAQKTTTEQFQSSEIYMTLDSISRAYEEVQVSYTYKPPSTNAETKTTQLKSQTEFEMSDSTLKDISDLLASARTKISEK